MYDESVQRDIKCIRKTIYVWKENVSAFVSTLWIERQAGKRDKKKL